MCLYTLSSLLLVASAPLKDKPFPGALNPSKDPLCSLCHQYPSLYWVIPVNINLVNIIHLKTNFLDPQPCISCHSRSMLDFTAKILKNSWPPYLHLHTFFFSIHTPMRHLTTALHWSSPHQHTQWYYLAKNNSKLFIICMSPPPATPLQKICWDLNTWYLWK